MLRAVQFSVYMRFVPNSRQYLMNDFSKLEIQKTTAKAVSERTEPPCSLHGSIPEFSDSSHWQVEIDETV